MFKQGKFCCHSFESILRISSFYVVFFLLSPNFSDRKNGGGGILDRANPLIPNVTEINPCVWVVDIIPKVTFGVSGKRKKT